MANTKVFFCWRSEGQTPEFRDGLFCRKKEGGDWQKVTKDIFTQKAGAWKVLEAARSDAETGYKKLYAKQGKTIITLAITGIALLVLAFIFPAAALSLAIANLAMLVGGLIYYFILIRRLNKADQAQCEASLQISKFCAKPEYQLETAWQLDRRRIELSEEVTAWQAEIAKIDAALPRQGAITTPNA